MNILRGVFGVICGQMADGLLIEAFFH